MTQSLECAPPVSSRQNLMDPTSWIPVHSSALLDVGCNVGELLKACSIRLPAMRLAGIDINKDAVQVARKEVPHADIREGYGFELPFHSASFDCVTCIEVIEHIPAALRPTIMSEMQRVLTPGGRLILRCPHAGLFGWLDAQNFRFLFPRLYRWLVKKGGRDGTYAEAQEELVRHHHFTLEELTEVAGPGWRIDAHRFGGLILFPVSDILRWPFYRAKKTDNWIVRILERICAWELGINFGRGSFDVLLILTKI